MHTIIAILYFWFTSYYRIEAVLPERIRIPKFPTTTNFRYPVLSDTSRRGQLRRQKLRTSRKLLEK